MVDLDQGLLIDLQKTTAIRFLGVGSVAQAGRALGAACCGRRQAGIRIRNCVRVIAVSLLLDEAQISDDGEDAISDGYFGIAG